ncbi:lactate dehydrogenase-like oxidoreductase [Desulfocurvibacter africanus PCS]|uniref:Lactate dehydrogenase-like oxidoreductase n=1 Tax=Desulfocurvibacter africanus PCS TaxID=1262666 RepID=M5PVX9_DESAF|nr:D-2-hydroxyacid dehydrogenase [Desulfocurvibacter africanus]EMG38229.1 lactate dehydrogenase-like oxidoreductase [Desulfocurvibacter africanus PCS]
MNIVVLDGKTLNPGDNPWDDLASLGELTVHDRTAPSEVVERARDADILLTNKTRLPAEVIEALPKLKLVSVLATGYDVVDVAACARRGIPVSNVPGYGTASVAQHVFALILELANEAGAHDAAVKAGEWRGPDWCFWKRPVLELAGRTMGIVGLGSIGRAVAHLAHAFGMRVVANSRSRRDMLPYPGFAWLDLPELFAVSDVISLHCPQTKDNAGFVNKKLLERMKPEAMLVNTARGGLVNEADLADALNAGAIRGAGLDVVSVEPIRSDNPLLAARNCIITPHMAWASREARRRLMVVTTENVRAFLAGKPLNVVNGLT